MSVPFAVHGLYFVTAHEGEGRDHATLAAAAIRGGARIVQFRDKDGDPAARYETARAVRDACRAGGAAFVVNDDAGLAMELRADGLHLGQDDLGELTRWRPSWPALLGVSVTGESQVDAALAAGADYLGAGPVFATASKPDAAAALGVGGLSAICRRATVPVAAIGGIGVSETRAVIAAGASAVCVIAAVSSAPDPEGAARELTEAIAGCVKAPGAGTRVTAWD